MSRIVQYSRYGGPEVLDVVEVAEPHAGAGEVRVAVRAAGLNNFDSKVRRSPDLLPHRVLPSGQGSEFAGVIDELGDGVSTAAVGDEVLGWSNFTAQAEFVVVPVGHVAPKPPGLDWAIAGGLGLGDDTEAAQLAIAEGAIVIGTAGEGNHDYLRGLGIIPVAYGPGMIDRLRAAAPQGIDAVLDNAGQETVEVAIELGVDPKRINSIVYFEGAAEYGISNIGGGGKKSEDLGRLARLVADGTIQLPLAATYPLAEVRRAYEQLESRHLRGKIVLTLP
jgi:NADPH:quinone reductase-like Zn-dependent oxidoreductase